MKRLTKKLLPYDPFGWVGGVYLAESKKTDLCPKTFCKNGTKCDLNQDRTCPFLAALDRLAEYEDTGLMPDEIEKMKAPRDWTPCAEGKNLPTDEKVVLVTGVHLPLYDGDQDYPDTVFEAYRSSGAWKNTFGLRMAKTQIIAWMDLPAPYRADDTTGKVREDAEKKSHNPQECKNCDIDRDLHKSYLICTKHHGGIDRDPSICDGCVDFKKR